MIAYLTSRKPRLRCAAGLVAALLAAAPVWAALGPEEQKIADWCAGRRGEMTALLEQAVKIDSATENHAGVRAVGELFGAELTAMGFKAQMIDQAPALKRGPHLFAERTGTRGKRLLLIGHLDTVLPGGKFTVDGDTGRGSGVGDMKGGDIVLLFALKALHAAKALENTQVVVAMTGDEEAPGIPVEESRKDFVAAAKRSDIALAFEGAIKGEGTVARRGSSGWTVEVSGPTGHSSGVFSQAMGSGAVYEAARILDAFHTELRKEPALTANVAAVAAGADVKVVAEDPLSLTIGAKSNIIPPRVFIRGDIRAASPESLARAEKVMREIVAKNGLRTSATLAFEYRYPPMATLPQNLEVLAVLDGVSRDLGHGPVKATDPLMRGAGDSAFASPHAAVLDGLGAYGMGAHAERETVDLASLPVQAARAAVLIYRLTR